SFSLPAGESCDLLVTAGDLFAYRMNFQPGPDARQQVDWTLTETRHVANVSGQVVDRVLTDDQGKFNFANLPPGYYRVRAQIPGGRVWLSGGRILHVDESPPEAGRVGPAALELTLAPFKKGRFQKFTAHADDLASDYVEQIFED